MMEIKAKYFLLSQNVGASLLRTGAKLCKQECYKNVKSDPDTKPCASPTNGLSQWVRTQGLVLCSALWCLVQLFHDKEWLLSQYTERKNSMGRKTGSVVGQSFLSMELDQTQLCRCPVRESAELWASWALPSLPHSVLFPMTVSSSPRLHRTTRSPLNIYQLSVCFFKTLGHHDTSVLTSGHLSDVFSATISTSASNGISCSTLSEIPSWKTWLSLRS